MKTKIYRRLAILLLTTTVFSSCSDFLDIEKPNTIDIKDAYANSSDALAGVTAAYAPMLWEFQNNVGSAYFPEWFIGDVCSDDALKGSNSLSDMETLYEMENFKTRSDNTSLWWFYRCQYIGIFRCNQVFDVVPYMDPTLFSGDLQNRIIGEALFLRAYYYLRLARVFGGVPLVDSIIKYQDEWKKKRASAEDIYNFIYDDLVLAIQYLPEKYAPADLGRATKGAARALLMKAYMANVCGTDAEKQQRIDAAKLQGDTIIDSNVYSLVTVPVTISYEGTDENQDPITIELKYNPYEYIFTLEGENNTESVFEAQYIGDGGSDLWNGLGYTIASIAPLLTRPRWGQYEGWGFNRPTQELYDEFELGDMRREATIYNPTEGQLAASDDNTMNLNVYLGNRYTSLKYVMMRKDTTFIKSLRDNIASINRKDTRYSDVLLLYAETCCKSTTPNYSKAKWALEEVRSRARIDEEGNVRNILPEFPNYRGYLDTPEDLYKAIQHERRVELAMEGHRWFDLVRWGIAAEVMNNYRATTKPKIAEQMEPFVKGKHELFPIPLQERDMNDMPQNPGYDGVPVN